MVSAPVSISTLVKRSDFVRLSAKGRRVGCETLVIQALEIPTQIPSHLLPDAQNAVRTGFTVTKKQGNAVLRNRVKRRLRAAVRETFPAHAQAGMDYVLIGKTTTATCAYTLILRDMKYALRRLAKTGAKADRAPAA